MDSPFFPAIVCFGPFFLILLASVIFRRGERPVRVQPGYVIAALLVSLGIGLGGAILTFLMV